MNLSFFRRGLLLAFELFPLYQPLPIQESLLLLIMTKGKFLFIPYKPPKTVDKIFRNELHFFISFAGSRIFYHYLFPTHYLALYKLYVTVRQVRCTYEFSTFDCDPCQIKMLT